MLRRKDEKTSYQTGPDQAGRTEPNIQQQRLLHFSKEHIKNGQTNGRITYTRTDGESYGQTDRLQKNLYFCSVKELIHG